MSYGKFPEVSLPQARERHAAARRLLSNGVDPMALRKAARAKSHSESFSTVANLLAFRDTSTHFEHQNWIGTERMRTSYNGSVEAKITSLPFGDAYATTGSPSDPYDFAGLNRDGETGNENGTYREYSPIQGRWFSPDPYDGSYDITNPQSFNRYAYVLNNPLSYTDTSGECAEITAGITQGPNTASGQALISIAAAYGANVAFPYAGLPGDAAVANIAGAGIGLNQGATDVASAALAATLAGSAQNGSGFFSLGFSGGAQANVSAGAGTGAYANAAFYDPGIGVGQSLPPNATVFQGVGGTSALVAASSLFTTSPLDTWPSSITNCGHDVGCAIQNSPALQAALKSAGPCPAPKVFTPRGYIPYLGPFSGYLPFLWFSIGGDDSSVDTSYGGTTLNGQPVPNPN